MSYVFAAEEPNGYFLPGDINEFYWGSAAFLVVVGFIIWKGGPPIKRAMQRRTERIEAELAAAAQLKADAEAELAHVTAQLGDADAESERIVAEARQTADRLKTDLKAKADGDAAEMRQRVLAEIEASKVHAAADLEAQVTDMTLGAAEVVVAENLDDNTQTALIENYIREVGARA